MRRTSSTPGRAPLHARLSVAEVLERRPETVSVFARLGMACPGCAFAPFETLAEVAATYGLDEARLLRALETLRAPKRKRRPDMSTQVPDVGARLDVRPIPPVRKHATIFATFDALAPGASFTLVNDHDPKPLYYQFAAELAGRFEWEYLERGPEVYRVRIGKPARS
jgi:hybrid cluster-associated redox disulfide protein